MNTINKKNSILLGIGLLIGLVLRLTYINIPIFEVLSEHQEKYAMIARNYYYHGLNIFNPELNYLGTSFNIIFFKLHLFSFFVSLIYVVLGGVFEISARFVSISFAVASAYFIYRLASDVYDKRVGTFSAIIFFISPLSIIYTRTFLPDALNLFFLSGVILFSYRWIYQEKNKYFWYNFIFLSTLLLLNHIYIVVYIPLLFMIVNKYKKSEQYNSFYVSAILIFPILLLFLWFYSRMNFYNLNMNDLILYLGKGFSFHTLITLKFWVKFLERVGGIVLTPIGVFFLIRSLFINKKDLASFIVVWFIASFAAILLWNNLFLHEKQYYLFFLITSSILIGKEFAKVELGFRQKQSKWFYNLLNIIVFIMIVTQIANAYTYSHKYAYIVDASSDLKKFADKNDKIVVTKRLYYYNRDGWVLDLDKNKSDDNLIKQIENYKKAGAKYFIVSDIYSYRKYKKFLRYILDNYKELVVQKGYRVYKLEGRREK